jgi:hypothetical protein
MRAKGGVKGDISRLYSVFQAANHILTGGNGMNSKRIQLLLTGVAAWISLLLMITTTYAGSIVIGGDYTDIGTIVVITPNPGNPTANGTALLNNLADITGGVNNPYLIKLGPGIYDIGTSSLQMKQYVDVEGSGENTTTITGNIDSYSSGVVLGANNAEIRFLTVQNIGGGSYAYALFTNGLDILLEPSTFKMTHMTASASGGTHNAGVVNASSSPTMTNVTASASGGTESDGVFNVSASPTMTNVTASGSDGGTNRGVRSITSGTIRINHSVIKGSTNTVLNGSGTTTYVGNTQLDGGPVSNSETLTCAGVYDGNYTFYASTCP